MPYHEQTDIRIRLIRAAGNLRDLVEWEPVGARIEDVRSALAGVGGISDQDLRSLEAMADRWAGVDQRLRDLYVKELDGKYSRAVSVALSHIFSEKARKRAPSPTTYGAVRDLWVEHYGHPPSIEMIPRSAV